MKKKIIYIATAALFFGCELPKEVVKKRQVVDYTILSVPEESGLRLVQYTDEVDKVIGPLYQYRIWENGDTKNEVLVWDASTILAVSPDNKKIAYLGRSNGYSNLFVKKVDGAKTKVQRTFNQEIKCMNYSPDGEKIIFTDRKSSDDIYVLGANGGSDMKQIATTNASELSATYSPDGENVFFAKSEGTRYYIWSLSLKSTLLTQYAEGFTPCITPDGLDLIVTRNSKEGYRGEIWKVNIDRGTGTKILEDSKKGYSSPQISPDGKRLICVGSTEKDKSKPQNLDLYILNMDGSKLTQLTFHGGHDASPVWSKDGKSIFFISQRGNKEGKWNVWKMGMEKILKNLD